MKKSFLSILVVVLLVLAAACNSFSNRGTIDRPFIESASSNFLSFEKVELTDSSTVLYGVIHFRPHWWVQLADSSSISADGRKYYMTSIEGIATGEQVWMPDSGVIHFVMTYPAIPSDVRSIDFSEDTPDGWQIWGIDLTGKAGHDLNIAGVPAELRKPSGSAEIPQPEFKNDSATVNIHLLGYRQDMGSKLSYAINTLHGQMSRENIEINPANGSAIVKVALSAPAQMMTIGTNKDIPLRGVAYVAPGETVDLYVDTHYSGLLNMATRDGNEPERPDDLYFSYSSGKYRDLNFNPKGKYYGLQLYNGEFGDYHMDGDAYTAYLIGQYKAMKDSLDADKDLSPVQRMKQEIKLQSDLIAAAVEAKRLMVSNYYHAHDNWGERVHPDSIPLELSGDNAREIASYIDFNNPYLALGDNISDSSTSALWENHGIEDGLMGVIAKYSNAYDEADKAALTENLLAPLREVNPAMAEEVEAHQAATKAKLESLDYSKITPTPDVADNKLFDAIVAPHKGKVVMVDLWNTWCGPCRAALAQNEPEKSGDLSSDDIVWIYIADESSTLPKYIEMIQDIRGIHYRVSPDQIAAIRSRFEVDGIPYYILVDRKGKATGRPDLRDHDKFKKTVLDEVSK